MEQFSIKDLERLSGIKAHTIRVWERRYRIIEPLRTDTNRRRYTGNDLRRIINIANLQRSGLKISKIAKLTDKELDEKTAMAIVGSTDGIAEIDNLVLAMFELNTRAVNETIMKSVLKRGFEDTVTEVIFPFMDRVGAMWQTGTVTPGYEHFITGLFRARLIAAIDSISDNPAPSAGRAVLFLPENELHELPLLFTAWVVKKMGFEIIYLGQMNTLSSVVALCEKWNPDFVITGTLAGLPIKPLEYLTGLSELFKGRKILIGGTLANIVARTPVPNITPIRSVRELKASMSSSSAKERQ